jgi:hypothetical protein
MTDARGGHRSILPFRPTSVQTQNYNPSTCFCCGRHAMGVGVGNKFEPKFLCELCIMIIEQIKAVTNWDHYELLAVERGGEAAGAYLDRIGKTDLATLTQEEWGFFLREVIAGFGTALRKIVKNREVPF